MRNTYKIIFEKGIPPIDEVVTKLREVTGLSVIYDSEHLAISAPEHNMDVIITDQDNSYEIFKYNPIIDYLLGNTLFVLVALGGEYEGDIPEWAGKKWNVD